MTFDVDTIFKGAWVPPWLRRFEVDADGALMQLVTGGAELGHLGPREPQDLLVDWIEAFGDRGFAVRLDEAMARWIDHCWGKPVLTEAMGSARLVADAWCQVNAVISRSHELLGAASRLREHVMAEPTFLDALTEGRSRDPLVQAWLALANHQQDRGMLATWWRLCNLPPDEPWYRGECGIFGLRGLPPERSGQGGVLPEELPEGLLRLAEALAGRANDGWLDERIAREEWERIAKLTMGAYPFAEKWVRVLRRGLLGVRNETAASWVQALFPGKLDREARAEQTHGGSRHRPDPRWPKRGREIAARLRESEHADLTEAEGLLREEELYAKITGDAQYLVRSACNFASRLRDRQPAQALTWAELARRHDPWNAYAWTTTAACLQSLHRLPEARSVYEDAIERFPDNVVARTGLAEVLKAQGALEQAEAAYRDTIERFPDNVVARTGLAEVLKAQGALEQAEAAYRDTIEHFPDNVVARTGLAEVLKAQGALEQAEAVYRDTIQRFPDDPVARRGLANVRKPQRSLRNYAPAHPTPSPPPVQIEPATAAPVDEGLLEARDLQILLTDVRLLRRFSRRTDPEGQPMVSTLRDRARALLSPFVDHDARAAGELGLTLLTDDDLEGALDLLRDAQKRFPGSARVRYALARAERACAAREQRRLDDGAVTTVIQPWKRLARLNARYRPISQLGEGRAWSVLHDGITVEQSARNAFGQLARWTDQHRRIELRDEHDSRSFDKWWAQEVHTCLFGGQDVRSAADIEDLEPIRERLALHQATLDIRETEYVERYTRV